ncbi:MAG TPA: site-specific DNA-methyltransferase [Gemmatimonadaceae bacterium]|nr:site-specific DNA-methyltransferase [Gemmatimonadaceae bacterium]
MQKLEPRDPETESRDLVAQSIARCMALFPEAWTGERVDFEVLKQLLGGTVEDRDEKFGLNWHGKRRAREIALTPSAATLLPSPDESIDWGTTRNLVIEGDNLEVLKLLQKSYSARIKMIYIDPPYNTGNDFIYPDDFSDNVANYLRITGQTGADSQTSANPETAGRFHTTWLNMIYPRLKVARNLLRDDGVIFISIDDAEFANLRQVCNEIFGEENFLATFVRRRRMATGMRDNPVSPDHEYVVAYAKSLGAVRLYGVARNAADFRLSDDRGKYASTDLTVGMTREMRPNQFYAITNPRTGVEYLPPTERVWRFEPRTMTAQIENQNIIWPDDNPTGKMSRPRFKTRFDSAGEDAKTKPVSTWIGTRARDSNGEDDAETVSLAAGLNQEATKEVRDLFGEQLLEYPKPVSLVKALCALGSRDDDIVLDFFAGSGTTGHAVWNLNREDGGNRRFILVQLPEKTDHREYRTISAITMERLRRAGYAIGRGNPPFTGDLGFRAFRLASSNVRAWQPRPEDLDQAILDIVDNLVDDRTDDDLLYELILKRGLDLSVPVDERAIAGFAVQSVGGGALIVCLASSIRAEDAEALAGGIAEWHQSFGAGVETVCVFRDAAFADDVAKSNLTAILQQRGLPNVRSL